MTVAARRWYSVLLLRDTRGRFARLRAALPPARPTRPGRRRGALARVDAVQLVLF